jgi:AAA domain
VTLRTSAPGVTPHLHQSRWSLVSMSQREQLARMLRRRFPVEGVDWEEVVERLALIGLDHHRAGEPVVLVGRLARSPRPTYALDPLILQGELNLWYGAGGTAKTTTAVAACLTVQEHLPLLGLPHSSEPARALYLDWELSSEMVDGIVKRLAAGAGLTLAPELLYRRCAGALADQAEDLRRLIVERAVRFLVVDSLGSACGGEPESAEVVLRLVNAVRTFNVTVLLIEHVPRDGEEPFGSVYKFNAPRLIWRFRKQQEVGEDEVQVAAFNTKANLSALHRPLGWRLRFADETTTLTRIDPAEVAGFQASLPLSARILHALRDGALGVEDLAEVLGVSGGQVRARCSELHRRGKLVRLDRGEYGLPAHDERT